MSISLEQFSQGKPVTVTGNQSQELEAKQNSDGKGFFNKVGSAIVDYGKRVGQDYYKGAENIVRDINLAGQGKQNPLSAGLQTAGEFAKAVFAPITEAIAPAVEFSADKLSNDKTFQKIANSKVGDTIVNAESEIGTKYKTWAEQHPEAARNLEASVNIGLLLAGEKPGNKLFESAKQGVKTGVGGIMPPPGGGAPPAVRGAVDAVAEAAAKIPGTEPIANAASSVGRTVKNVAEKVVDTVQEANAKANRIKILPPAEQNAVRSGFSEQVVNFLHSATPEDKSAFQKMFDIAEKKATDLRLNTQPLEVAGQNILNQLVLPVSSKIKDLSYKVGQIVNKMPTEAIDITPEAQQFFDMLAKKGIEITGEGKLLENLAEKVIDGKGSALKETAGKLVNTGEVPSPDMKFYQMMYDLLEPDKNGQVLRTPQKLHAFRERVFEELNLAKARQETFSGGLEQAAEKFRGLLMKPLRNLDENYFRYSKQMAQSIPPLMNFVKLIGYKGNLDGIGAKTLRAGEVAARILGNAADRPLSTLSDLQKVVENVIGKKIAMNLTDQIKYHSCRYARKLIWHCTNKKPTRSSRTRRHGCCYGNRRGDG